jgi:hypothetical protein
MEPIRGPNLRRSQLSILIDIPEENTLLDESLEIADEGITNTKLVDGYDVRCPIFSQMFPGVIFFQSNQIETLRKSELIR